MKSWRVLPAFALLVASGPAAAVPAPPAPVPVDRGKLAKKPVFFEKAKNALAQLYKRRSKLGLVGEDIDVETGEWVSRASHIGGGIDSYYEYLLKCSRLFGDRECEEMWRESLRALNRRLADETPSGLWYGQVDMDTGKRTATEFGALHYLLFAPDTTLDLNRVVFNTEAHPLRRTW